MSPPTSRVRPSLAVFVSRTPARQSGTKWVISLSHIATLALKGTMDFVPHSKLRWLQVLPPVHWLAACASQLQEGMNTMTDMVMHGR